jgi:hypothetical protein
MNYIFVVREDIFGVTSIALQTSDGSQLFTLADGFESRREAQDVLVEKLAALFGGKSK